MGRIPQGQHVQKSIIGVEKAIKTAVKQINQEAGCMLAKGRYDKAEELISLAKAVAEFQTNVRVLRNDWQKLGRSGKGPGKTIGDITPQWEYYKPLLHCLIRLGGEAIRKEIEAVFETHCLHDFKPGDSAEMSRGVPRWKKIIQRCRKAMIKEGFLEQATGGKWRISAQGKKAAASEIKN